MESAHETTVLRWSESHDLEFRKGLPLIAGRYSCNSSPKNPEFPFYFAEELF